MSKIIAVNPGSSSIKISIFEKDSLKLLANGLAERIGLKNGLVTIKSKQQKQTLELELKNHDDAVEGIYQLMQKMNLIKNKEEIEYIGFRVVQGGKFFNSTTKLTEKEIKIIDSVSIYAPLHNPAAIKTIRGFQKIFPNSKLSADFDTAFHTTIDRINYTYAIPKELTEKYNIKKYGAHGISHQFITLKLEKILDKEKVNFVNVHLGNGASLCAIKKSKSFDTSMGLTPLAGIMMGTRSGDIDPSIHEFLIKETGLNITEITEILNKKSGVLGVSGISSDMRDVQKEMENNNPDALFAFEMYSQKVADYLVNYINKIGPKVDAIVFTAGIGENNPIIRKLILNKINIKNIVLDDLLNESKIDDFKLISSSESEIKVFVIRTNEELLITQNALKIYES
ncbi:acetate/propionate family kinase [Mycoplasma sp. CSL7503-lung]|uniref:acetate/propionate family kinase n=1 Tax=Mycoplasma sp. CSL7503-lung TaxID=536372 RepID=UPI0021D00F56|nr:acetate/propionate family kinase [Mycoplasma sp. CSL7503-lung]MCU4706896.1 acetate/propionate family kinase [Mycoplasma sp. CSL7503-lung]